MAEVNLGSSLQLNYPLERQHQDHWSSQEEDRRHRSRLTRLLQQGKERRKDNNIQTSKVMKKYYAQKE